MLLSSGLIHQVIFNVSVFAALSRWWRAAKQRSLWGKFSGDVNQNPLLSFNTSDWVSVRKDGCNRTPNSFDHCMTFISLLLKWKINFSTDQMLKLALDIQASHPCPIGTELSHYHVMSNLVNWIGLYSINITINAGKKTFAIDVVFDWQMCSAKPKGRIESRIEFFFKWSFGLHSIFSISCRMSVMIRTELVHNWLILLVFLHSIMFRHSLFVFFFYLKTLGLICAVCALSHKIQQFP